MLKCQINITLQYLNIKIIFRKYHMRKYKTYLFIMALFLSGCIQNDDSTLAKERINEFREMYKSSNFSEIYNRSSVNMMKNTSREGFTTFMKIAKSELGDFQTGQLTNINTITYLSGEPSIVITYRSEFKNAYITEVFSFDKKNNNLKLSGYRYTIY